MTELGVHVLKQRYLKELCVLCLNGSYKLDSTVNVNLDVVSKFHHISKKSHMILKVKDKIISGEIGELKTSAILP